MKISASRLYGNFGSGSLLGAYAQQARAAGPASPTKVEAPEVTASQLKSRLLTLSDRLKPFSDLSGAFNQSSSSATQVVTTNGSAEESSSTDSTTAPAQPAQPERVSIQYDGERKPIRFARQVNKAFQQGVKDEDSELLKGKRVSGDVNVQVGEGESKLSFSIRVDSNTTAQEFVDEFNAKAQGRATASLQDVNRGESGEVGNSERAKRLRIAITTQAPVQNPAPASEAPDSSSGVGELVRTELLGSSGGTEIGNLDVSSVAKDLKNFIGEFNRLVKLSESGDDGSNVLASTSVDEKAIRDIRNALETSSSQSGSVAVADLFSKGTGGTLKLNEQNLQRLGEEDPDGLVEALRGLAETVQGNDGVVEQYTGRKNLVDRAITNVIAQRAQDQVSSAAPATESRTEQVKRFEDAVPTIQSVVGTRIKSVA